jgi:hypothetical protein
VAGIKERVIEVTTKPTTKRSQDSAMSKEDLSKRIVQAKLELNTLLLTGEPTATARAALRALDDEQRALDAVAAAEQANKQAAQQALRQIEADRIAHDAGQLAAARANRIAMIGQRFRIPVTRSLAH